MKNMIRRISAGILAAAITASAYIGAEISVFAADSWPNSTASAEPTFSGYRVKDVKNWSPETDPYAEFLRAEVPLQKRNEAFKATQAKPYLNSDAEIMLMQGDYGNSFFNSTMYTDKFSEHVLNFWQYTDYFSPWHGAATAYTPEELYDPVTSDWRKRGFEFGIVNIPNPAYTNAAHKNGVMSIACIYFDPSFRPGQTCVDLIEKDENGEFSIADKLIEMAEYFGYDGYFLNQEEGKYEDFKPFMAKLTAAGLYTQWYDTNSNFNSAKAAWLKDSTHGQINNSVFVNYDWDRMIIQNSLTYASRNNFDPFKNVFFGAECNQNKFSGKHLSAKNIPYLYDSEINGNPRFSVALFTPSDYYQRGLDDDLTSLSDASKTPLMQQTEYQWMIAERERMFFSGVMCDPTDTGLKAGYSRPDVGVDNASGWAGVADFISERSVIDGTAFYTNFNTGHGVQYFKNGEVSADKEWTNINIQDILPSWQWWMESTDDTKLSADFDYGSKLVNNDSFGNKKTMPYTQVGAYDGGSSLVVYGNLTGNDSLHLYKTDLEVKDTTKVDITFKKTSSDNAQMKLGLIFKDNATQTVKLDIANSQTKGEWTTSQIDLSAYAGRNIAAITLEFEGTAANYQMNVGGLKVSDNTYKPAAPTGFTVDYAYDDGQMIVSWDLPKDNYGNVVQYNLYGTLSDGRRVYLGGTYDSILYVKSMFDETKVVDLELCAVGKDGTESDPAKATYSYEDKVSNITVEEAKTSSGLLVRAANPGKLEVSFNAPATGAPDSYEFEVTLRNIASDDPDNQVYTYTAEGTATSAEIPLPVEEGYEYDLKIYAVKGNVKGEAICYRGWSNDSYSEPIAKEDIRIVGTRVRMIEPDSVDWYKMTATFNEEEAQTFTRGVSSLYAKVPEKANGVLSVVVEDFAGNKSEPTIVYFGNGEIVDPEDLINETHFPDPVLLNAVKTQVGVTLPILSEFTGTLDLSNTEVADLTGIEYLEGMTGLNLTNCTSLTELSGLEKCTALKEINVSGCTGLTVVNLAGLALEKIESAGEYSNLVSVDISNNKLDLSEGTPERAFLDKALKAVKDNPSAVLFDNQRPKVYASIDFLKDSVSMERADGETLDLLSYATQARTIRGTEYSSLDQQLINGSSFIAADLDLTAKPAETFTVSAVNQNREPVLNGILDLSVDATYTVEYHNAQNVIEKIITIVVGDGGEVTKIWDITENPTVLYATSKYNQKDDELPKYAFDKIESTRWSPGTYTEKAQMVIDVGDTYRLIDWDMVHAGVKDDTTHNTCDFDLQILKDPNATESQLKNQSYLTNDANWVTVASYRNNKLTRTHYEFTERVVARYFRLNVIKGSSASFGRTTKIHEWTMHGVVDSIEPEADKTELQKLVDSIGAEENYTPNSWEAFKPVFDRAVEVLADENATQDDVDDAKTALESAAAALVEKADKEALQAAYDANKDRVEEEYTTETWAAFKAALDKAAEVLADENATQDDVDTAKAALENAAAALVEKADKEALQAVYDANKDRVEEDYTTATWTAFKVALDKAVEVLADENATQDDVDTAKAELERTAAALAERGDNTNLNALITYAEAQKEKAEYEDVVLAVKEAFEAALAKAQEVAGNIDATQDEINAAYDELLDKTWMLSFVGSQKKLQELYDLAEALDLEYYTEKTAEVLRKAMEAAETVLGNENALQAEIDEAYNGLKAAIDGLKLKVDKDALGALIEKAEAIDLSKYLESSKTDFAAALENAKAVYADEDATAKEIYDAYNRLQKAIFDLRLIPDKSLLEDLLNKATEVDESKYTAESYGVLKAAMAEATAVLNNAEATETEVKAAEAKLENALDGLVLTDAGETPEEPANPEEKPNNPDKENPNTDDSIPYAVPMALVLAAGAVFIIRKRATR